MADIGSLRPRLLIHGRTALHRLMEQYQQTDPFKFLIYAELAGAEIGPVQ